MATPAEQSSHMADHNEYVTVQSALQSFEDRFEAHLRSQSRLLEGIHVTLQHHEKHLRRQQKRIEQLEDLEKLMQSRLEVLSGQLRKAEQGIAAILIENSRGSKHRQVGRFSISETPERTPDHDIGLRSVGKEVLGNGTRSSVQDAASLSALGFPSACKSDEEAWEEYLGFDSRHTDLRPQHSYRKPQATIRADEEQNGTTANEKFTVENQHDLVQSAGHIRSGGEHKHDVETASSSTPRESRLSIAELLDQLSEELMGFERERRAEGGSA